MNIKISELIKSSLAEVRKEFKGTEEEFRKILTEKSSEFQIKTIELFATGLLEFYKEYRVSEIRNGLQIFHKNHQESYGESLNLFLSYIDITVTLGSDTLNHFKSVSFPEDDRLKFNQLILLHARACQTMNEIFSLIESGYSDAALARWRTLHEICVVFICLFSGDNELSRRYYDFQIIEKLNRADNFQEHHQTINWKKIDPLDIHTLESERDRLVNKYGKDFVKSYGWAKKILTKGCNFKGLEEHANLSYLRPFYLWANSNVHSGSEGLYSRLSFDNVFDVTFPLLCGPTRFGLADPVQFTTHSMLRITSGLVGLVNTLENEIMIVILQDLHDQIAKSLIKAEATLPSFKSEI